MHSPRPREVMQFCDRPSGYRVFVHPTHGKFLLASSNWRVIGEYASHEKVPNSSEIGGKLVGIRYYLISKKLEGILNRALKVMKYPKVRPL